MSRALPLVLLAFVALPGAHAGARAGCPRDAALGAVAYARGGPGPWVGTWAPRGHRMAAVTRRGGVVVGGPGLKTRRLVADGFGASSVAWDGAALVVGQLDGSVAGPIANLGRTSNYYGHYGWAERFDVRSG